MQIPVALPLDHALDEKLLEGLFDRADTDRMEKVIDKSSEKHVKCGVLFSTNVQVNWHPFT